MSHRARSRTVDSADGKKPRRLTEKIAIMKKREHEQSEAFEHAMKSIYEVGVTVGVVHAYTIVLVKWGFGIVVL